MRTLAIAAAALALTAGVASATTFHIADRNGDDVVTKSEFLKIYGPELDAFSFSVIDDNNDGTVSAEEYRAAQNGPNGPLVEGS